MCVFGCLHFDCLIFTRIMIFFDCMDVDNDPCSIIVSCQDCVTTPTKPAPGNNGTCIYELTRTGSRCVKQQVPSEEVINAIYKPDGCKYFIVVSSISSFHENSL